MNAYELKEILDKHEQWLKAGYGYGKRAELQGAYLRGANLRRANLRGAYLRGANLQEADLRLANLQNTILLDANLSYADLRGAKLRGANLSNADVRRANLRRADLRGALLRCANLRGVDLRGADLRGADIDYSSWPLWCGSLDVKIDARIAAQLMYHTLRAMQSCARDDDVAAVLRNDDVIRLANRFHRVKECGMIEGGAACNTSRNVPKLNS